LIVTSLVGMLASDTMYALAPLTGAYGNPDPRDLGWLLWFACLGAAALHPSMRTLHERALAPPTRLNRARVTMLLGTVLVAPTLLVIQAVAGKPVSLPVLLAGMAVLFLAIPDALPLLATDPGLLERALANLVANALRYSPPGRPPTLAAAASDSTVTVSVIDHGPGIALDQRERVFEPFQQLGDQRTAGGVGLGLAVAKGFVDAVGGRITATTTRGGGLTMRVDLPVAAPTHDAAGARP
jgi:signal transduction histidine kinase